MAILAFVFAAIVGFFVRVLKVHATKAWFIGCTVVPVFVLFAVVASPSHGGGSVYGVICAFGAVGSALGVFLAGLFIRGKKDDA